MSLERTPLAADQLTAGVARACGPQVPAPARMMAARGLAPMGPEDLVTALYQLSCDADEKIAAAAVKTATGLPEKILGATLGAALDPRVLDFFAELVVGQPAAIEKILLNRAVDDQTFVDLAKRIGERELEILAQNQERLLRTPAIIESIYFNRKARMSTVDRLLEMAVRNGVTLDAVPQFKTIAANIMGAPPSEEPAQVEVEAEGQRASIDEIFDTVLGDEAWDQGPVGSLEFDGDGESDERTKAMSEMTVNERIRMASIGSLFHRMVLVRDSNRSVAMAAISSGGVSEQEAARYASNRGISEDVIRYIAAKKEWQKNYQIKVALVNNPKTPLAQSMKLLMHLRANDLRAIARSKNIPSALAKAAKRATDRRR